MAKIRGETRLLCVRQRLSLFSQVFFSSSEDKGDGNLIYPIDAGRGFLAGMLFSTTLAHTEDVLSLYEHAVDDVFQILSQCITEDRMKLLKDRSPYRFSEAAVVEHIFL